MQSDHVLLKNSRNSYDIKMNSFFLFPARKHCTVAVNMLILIKSTGSLREVPFTGEYYW